MQSVRALIVDNSSVMRKIVERCLRQAGVELSEVKEANNGTDALDIAAKNPLDLILCDINMPIMDGIEFIRRLKHIESAKTFPSSLSVTRAGNRMFCTHSPRALAGTSANPLLLIKLRNTFSRYSPQQQDELRILPARIATCAEQLAIELPERRREQPMKKLGLCVLLVCACSFWAVAQDSSDKGKADTRTVTGCLQQTSHNNQFLLKANDGSSWNVSSDTASLAEHVGHTVSVTGVVSNSTAHNMKEDAKDVAHDSGMKKHNAEHGHMKVTDLQMVSSSCSQ